MELLLQAGAQVDFRQTQKDSERATPPAAGLYGGHLAWRNGWAGGASLQARQPLGLGPVHMAAKRLCALPGVAAGQGWSLVEPAPASRGETPAMLAAAKGPWPLWSGLQAQGVDLWSCDAHGKTALDWGPVWQNRQMRCAGCKSASQWRLRVQV